MTNEQVKEDLLKAGVKNLKQFGYPEVTTETILTDEVYKGFFKSMLKDNRGNGKQIDEVIDQLLKVVEDFYCADWNRCGSICESQCDPCKKAENMPDIN